MSAQDVVYFAQSQVGYLGKQSNAQLEDFTANINGKHTKYGAAFGINPGDFCDMFVSVCGKQAGEGSAVGWFAYVPAHIAWFNSQGRFYRRGSITPQAGDIIFFEYYTDGVVDGDHVGIVESCSGGYVYTIEGNTRNSAGLRGVFRKTYSLGDGNIYGYGRPNYAGSGGGGTELKIYSPWKVYRNGSTEEIVFSDTGLSQAIGSLNPGEECWCTGRYGDAYHIFYRVDGTENWKSGYVGYDGGVED